MPVTVMPVGVRCNLQCGYCYEDPQRDAGDFGSLYDLAAIKAAVEQSSGGPFLLFGGEPLLMKKTELEDLWAWGYERFGRNTVQTNGTLIDDDHIALFQRYNVRVSISIDGPGPLNDARWQGTLARTRAATRRTEAAIERLCALGTPPGMIVVLHRLNATGPALERLVDWFKELEALGMRGVGIHLLELENADARRKYAMSEDENVNALLRLRELRKNLKTLRLDLLTDLEALLLGDESRAKCIWTACDPYNTRAVEGIGGHGESIGCGRVVKDGVAFLRSEETGYERYLALYRTPQAAGGCADCRFFLMCRGQCPGTAVDGDWRNKTDQCGIWMRVFAAIESDLVRDGKEPLSLSPIREEVEQGILQGWEHGRRITMATMVRQVRARQQQTDPTAGAEGAPPRPAVHGDDERKS
jgi:uncharacterized protein